ncbi:MAG: hypothetical protein HC890_11235 [Chloroflexaceae bacterium]|nr:hypothetical protein [Chloroflexaceae bacterium]
MEPTLEGTPSPAIASLQPQSLVVDSPRETVNQNLAMPLEAELEASTTWIETEAIAVGYVKHPLERVLEWLDRIILWLEETVAALWRWLQQKLSKTP